MSECVICCDKFTKKIRKPVECSNCQFSVCMRCVEKFILESTTEAKCMNCNHAFSFVFLHENFTNVFIQRYRKHRSNILWTRQLYQLPVINEYISLVNQEKKIKNRIIELKQQKQKMSDEFRSYRGRTDTNTKIRRAEIRIEKNKIDDEIILSNREQRQASRDAWNIRENFTNNKNIKIGRINNRPCITENCKGFLNNSGECPICSKITCLTCNNFKNDDNHECNKDDIETWNNMKKNTRPCPKCSTRIHKISGCDQMFCVMCHTAFSWQKGTIETGPIHNPHYYETMFQNAERNNRQDIHLPENILNCEEEDVFLNIHDLRYFLRDKNCSYETEQALGRIHRRIQHLISGILPIYEENDFGYRSSLFTLLHKHINGFNSEAKFESNYQRQQVNNELYAVINSLKRQKIHLFKCWMNDRLTLDELETQIDECDNFYFDTLKKFSKVYKRKMNYNHMFGYNIENVRL